MDAGSFDWNNLVTTLGQVAGKAVEKPDTYNNTYVTESDNMGNKLLIAGVVAVVVLVVFKFIKK